MSVLNLEIDSVLQRQAEETFSKIGLPVSDAINIFLKAAVRYGGLPFENKFECRTEETYRLVDDNDMEGPFNTVAEVMEALNAPD